MDEIAVLVLNYTYEPLHFTNARRAITLLLAGKAESGGGLAPRDPVALAGVRAPRGDPARGLHPQAVPGAGGLQQEEHPAPGRLHLPVLQPARRAADGRPHRAALARGRDQLDQRGGGLPALQPAEGQPATLDEVGHATDPRAGAPKFVFSTHMLRHPHAHSFLDSWRKYLVAVPTPS